MSLMGEEMVSDWHRYSIRYDTIRYDSIRYQYVATPVSNFIKWDESYGRSDGWGLTSVLDTILYQIPIWRWQKYRSQKVCRIVSFKIWNTYTNNFIAIRYLIQYQIPNIKKAKYHIKKVKYCIVAFMIWNTNMNDFIATWMPPHKGNSLFISKFPKRRVLNLTKLGPWEADNIVKNIIKVSFC